MTAPSLPTLPTFSGARPRGSSPFGTAAPSLVAALGYLVALVLWLVAGESLPGGRPFAIHLFTLGVLTNLVLTFSEHFARTVTRAPDERSWWWPITANLGIAGVLVGLLTRWLPVVAIGATTLLVVVFLAYRRLRRLRQRAIGARFTWVVRVYERAHGAFLHGAILGAVLGIGVLGGAWFGAVRVAHLHAMVLGWGGLTLLATLVFFGPTMARTRIEPGADARAVVALRHGATGLSAAILLLVATGIGEPWEAVFRVPAGAALAAYAVAASYVCAPVFRAVKAAKPTAARPLVLGVCVWFPLVVWADVAVLTLGALRWLDALGIVALVGVLAQAVLATVVYLAPMLRGRTTEARDRVRQRLERGQTGRALAIQGAVGITALGAAPLLHDLPIALVGWLLLFGTVLATVVTILWPVPAHPGDGR